MPSRSYGSEVGGDMRGCGRGVLGLCFQFVATLLAACASAYAQTAGTLTLAEGRVQLIRGATLYSATQGVRLGDGDILSIDPKGQAQIEFQDGAILNLSQGEQPATLSSRPSAEFLKNMPRQFRDDLPVLLERFKSRRSEPKREHEVTYAEVEAWLKAGSAIRRNFVKRFEGRSKDSEFRRKLIENLREHPEWDKVLFPEKYAPKGPNNPKSGQSGTQK